jgi:hypothetical protein
MNPVANADGERAAVVVWYDRGWMKKVANERSGRD